MQPTETDFDAFNLPPPLRARGAREMREHCFSQAMRRAARNEDIGVTIARAEAIRKYIEDGVVDPASPEPCST